MGSIRWPWFIIVILIVIIVILVIRPPCPPCPPIPPVTQTEFGTTVQLIIDRGSDPETPVLSRLGEANHIRWKNTTSVERKVTFISQWPFFGAQTDIVIPASSTSAWFTLDPSKPNATYPYQVNPSLFGPGTTPTGPTVTAGD